MSKNTKATSPAPRASSPSTIRNVVLVGPDGTGKSTLFSRLASADASFHAGQGHDPRSVSLVAGAVAHGDTLINLLDTPGHPDFVAELRAGLRAADAAVFVISGSDAIDRSMSLLWQECAAIGMPRAIVVTHLDQPRADFDATVAAARHFFGDAQPLALPVIEGGEFASVLPLLDASDGDVADRRAELIEAIIEESEDDTLLERYLEGEQLDTESLRTDARAATASARFFPVLPVSPVSGVGVERLLDLIVNAFPSPVDATRPAAYTPQGADVPALTADADAPLVAEVIQTSTDPYVGRLSLLRVFQGTLRPDTTVHVSGHLENFEDRDVSGHPGHDSDERVGALSVPTADGASPVDEAIAGQLVLVAKLQHAETSDTLSDVQRPVLVEPWHLPEPLLPVAIRAEKTSEDDKLAGALQRLVSEDMTMRMEHNPETHQAVLWTMGQAHVDELTSRLRDRYGVAVVTEPFRTALRETFLKPVTVRGRHVKQSGGHGQFAVCELTVEPLPRGSGFEFVDKVVGGSVPRQFIPSVEKGARAQLEKGLIAGYPVIDVRVTLFDGKAHSVDSSDVAFQTAAALALKEAAGAATMALLEPIDLVHITTADEYLGSVMADLNSRRGRVHGTAAGESDGWTVVTAEVPQAELSRYPIDLRSVSHGTGSFTREFARYDYMPDAAAREHLEH